MLVSIKRKGMVIIPRGDTRLLSGDVVTTLCEYEVVAAVRDLFLSSSSSPEINEPQLIEADPSAELVDGVDAELDE